MITSYYLLAIIYKSWFSSYPPSFELIGIYPTRGECEYVHNAIAPEDKGGSMPQYVCSCIDLSKIDKDSTNGD